MLINEENLKSTSRRQFLSTVTSALVGITVVGFVAPVLQSCSSPNAFDLTAGSDAGKSITVNVASLTSDGLAVHTTAPSSGRELLVIRRSATVYETLLLTCSHSGCSYPSVDISGSRIVCTCHNSVFDLGGNVLSGPGPQGLTKFTTVLDAAAKTVTVTF
jgi:Rieske Fe-S protein